MDVNTTYLGLKLKNPIVPSSSPLTGNIDDLRRLEDAGAAAVVLPSLFEEQIEIEARKHNDKVTGLRAPSPRRTPGWYTNLSKPDQYAELIQSAKASLNIPVIASLNGTTAGGWMRYTRQIEEAGADALELNVNILVTDPDVTAADVELRYMEPIRTVMSDIRIPVAVKLGSNMGALPHLARWIKDEGVSGLVLFNRFYQPDLDLERREVLPHFRFSRSEDLRLPLRWTAILFGRVGIDLAITTGVHTHFDVVKGIMAGANVTMMASALLEHGPGHVRDTLFQLNHWMEGHNCESVQAIRGILSQMNIGDPELYEREQYIKMVSSYRKGGSTVDAVDGPGRHPIKR